MTTESEKETFKAQRHHEFHSGKKAFKRRIKYGDEIFQSITALARHLRLPYSHYLNKHIEAGHYNGIKIEVVKE